MKPIETVDKCTTCSTCVAYCPVTKATRAFKGPKLTGPSSERFRLYDETGGGEISEIEALDYCSNCKNCDIACPSGVKISTLNMLARAEYCKRHKPPLRDWVLSHGRMLGRLARRFPGWLVNVGSTNALTRLILDKFGVDARAPMPVFVPRSFTEWMGDHNAMLTASDRSRLTKKAVFFPGCYVNDYDPQTGKDLVFMLEKAGYEVIVPEFECCGLPMVANGFFDDARAAASRNVDTLAALVSSGDVPVLTVCPSCQLMLKQEYAEYFPELGKHESIVPHVQDACEFLIGLIESGELDIDVREDATVVPTKSVVIEKGGAYVFVIRPDSIAERRMIELGPEVDNRVIVERGVVPGEKIVVEGFHKLTHGDKVDPVPVPEKSSATETEASEK